MRKKGQKPRVGFWYHVEQPGSYVGLFLFVLLFLLSCITCVLYFASPEVKKADGKEYHVSFFGWEKVDEDVQLHAKGYDLPFVLHGYENHVSHFEDLIQHCDGKTDFYVCAEQLKTKDGDAYYNVYILSANGVSYRSLEDSTAYHRGVFYGILLILLIPLGLFLASAILIYMVGRNPSRFPRWLVECCFKKNSIRW